jgi:ribonuclease-3
VLGWAIADIVFHRYDVAEGQLTDLRKSVVNAIALAEVAQSIGLGDHILLGRGEAAAGGADKPSILSDAFEALLGAVYLDGGADAAFEMVERLVVPRMPDTAESLDQFDQKTQLQEMSARAGRGAPVYEVTSRGPDHAKSFHARVSVDGDVLGEGDGRSKKAAEQAAAAAACRGFE